MKWLNRAILVAGSLTLALLLWHFSPDKIWADVVQVGAVGFLVIIPLQLVDHSFNALGWRFCFTPDQARGLPFWPLIKGRMAGDGVNYLTPSGTVAGEFIRPGIIEGVRPKEAVDSSVFVAKLSQSLGQPVFILVGLLVMLLARFNVLAGRELLLSIGASLLVVALVSLALWVLSATDQDGEGGRFLARFGGERVRAMRRHMHGYLNRHRGRFVIGTLFFVLGYGWGMVEVLLICRFMGVAVDPVQALAIETLSNVVDGLMFMVPAKLGTQEAGKALIFRVLGLPAVQGLSFGIVRHVRELVWASAGFAIYALNQRKRGRKAPEALPRSPQEPA